MKLMRFAENANLFKKYNRQRKSQANLSVERVDKVNQFAQVYEATQNNSGTISNNHETTTSRLRKKLLQNQSQVKNKDLEAVTKAMKSHLIALKSHNAISKQDTSDYKTKAIAHRLQLLASKQT